MSKYLVIAVAIALLTGAGAGFLAGQDWANTQHEAARAKQLEDIETARRAKEADDAVRAAAVEHGNRKTQADLLAALDRARRMRISTPAVCAPAAAPPERDGPSAPDVPRGDAEDLVERLRTAIAQSYILAAKADNCARALTYHQTRAAAQ